MCSRAKLILNIKQFVLALSIIPVLIIISAFYSLRFSLYVVCLESSFRVHWEIPYWSFENKYIILSWIINIVYLTYNTT